MQSELPGSSAGLREFATYLVMLARLEGAMMPSMVAMRLNAMHYLYVLGSPAVAAEMDFHI